MKREWFFLIILVAFFFRFFLLDSVPVSLFDDEVYNAWNSMNLLYNGYTVDGQFLPLFHDTVAQEVNAHETLFLYLSIPGLSLFGLSLFGVRFTSALIGVLTVIVSYFLGREFFNERVGLFSALLLAVSPWHIQFSRIAFRAILAPLFISLGLLFLHKKRFIIASIIFGLSLYTYTVVSIFLPLLLVVYFLLFKHQLLKHRSVLVNACVILAFMAVPIFINFFSGNERVSNTLSLDFWTNIVSYFRFFSPDFLFLSGDPVIRHSVRGVGQLLWFELPIILIGLFYLFKRKRFFLIAWLLLAPLPSALTGGPSALRSIIALPVFQLIGGVGLSQIRSKKFIVPLIVLMLFNVSFYAFEYFVNYNSYSGVDWGLDYSLPAKYVMSVYDDYDVFYDFHPAFLFYYFLNKEPFFFPNYLSGASLVNGTKFVDCFLLDCDYSRKHLLFIESPLAYDFLNPYYSMGVVEAFEVDSNVLSLAVIASPRLAES